MNYELFMAIDTDRWMADCATVNGKLVTVFFRSLLMLTC